MILYINLSVTIQRETENRLDWEIRTSARPDLEEENKL